MKLLNNRLSFTGDYFQEKRNNILALCVVQCQALWE